MTTPLSKINHLKLTLALVTVATFAGCGPSAQSQLKIIGGTHVAEKDPLAKRVAAIVTAANTVHCTAVAVNTSTFLTAAHCIYGKKLDGWKIQSGASVGRGETLSIVSGEIHNLYDPAMMRTMDPEQPTYDLAVIKTEELARSIIPVPIIRGNLSQFTQTEQNITVAGYGRTDGQDPTSTGKLQKAILTIASFNENSLEFTTSDPDGKMACHVDSGAPAFIMINKQPNLVGLVSRGDRKCASGKTVFTDISQMKDYIETFAD